MRLLQVASFNMLLMRPKKRIHVISNCHPQGRGCTTAWRQEVERFWEPKPSAYTPMVVLFFSRF